jgi:hypothetical protein
MRWRPAARRPALLERGLVGDVDLAEAEAVAALQPLQPRLLQRRVVIGC